MYQIPNKYLTILLHEVLIQLIYSYRDELRLVKIEDEHLHREIKLLEKKIKQYILSKWGDIL